jgi:hypothetical protein
MIEVDRLNFELIDVSRILQCNENFSHLQQTKPTHWVGQPKVPQSGPVSLSVHDYQF